MLLAHLNAVENKLLASSKISANSGHSLHKGSPREWFIKEFLESHLSEQVAIGTGEIICADSNPNEARNQLDIVVYRRNFPKLDLHGGISAFLVESVIATIEVKSILDKQGMKDAVEAAHKIKQLPRSLHRAFSAGYQPPSILNYVIAYDGPASMETVLGWFPDIQKTLASHPVQKIETELDRLNTPSPSIDGVFVLGKGHIYFSNSPIQYEMTKQRDITNVGWTAVDTQQNNLFFLFMILTASLGGISGSWLNPDPYVLGKPLMDPLETLFLGIDIHAS